MAILARSRLAAAMLLGVLVSAGVECRNATGPTDRDALKVGDWGGLHLSMTVRADGATLEFDCGSATIDAAVVLDAKGAFDVRGKYFAQSAGPTLREETVPSQPVRFTGSVKSDEMTVRAVLTDENTELGTFTVGFGRAGRFTKCK